MSDRKEISHHRILVAASRAIRRAGYHGFGVADVMKEAGMTHGGFYAHFKSKDALFVDAVSYAGVDAYDLLSVQIAQHRASGETPFSALVKAYLSPAHAQGRETGCPIAALASEMSLQTVDAQAAFLLRIKGFMRQVQEALPAPANPSTVALVSSTLIGTLQMVRIFGADTPQGRSLLRQTQRGLISQFDHTHESSADDGRAHGFD